MATDVPVTIWRTTDGNTDSVYTGINYIVDPDENYIVDTLGNFLIDTGVSMPIIPATIWVENDAI